MPRKSPQAATPGPQAAPVAPLRLAVADIMERLGRVYGPVRAPRRWDPVSELIYSVLSQNTSDTNSHRAFQSLCAAYPAWDAVLRAETGDLAKAIWAGGLARIKAPRIQAILKAIVDERGGLALAFLKDMPVPDAKAWLRQLPGVGPKTAGCVLLFSLGRPAMVVDTHVYRVARRLGLLPARCSPDQAHDVLEALVPPEWYLPFHIYLITHGRRVCKAQRPLCAACVLEDGCPSSTLRTSPPGDLALVPPLRRRRGGLVG